MDILVMAIMFIFIVIIIIIIIIIILVIIIILTFIIIFDISFLILFHYIYSHSLPVWVLAFDYEFNKKYFQINLCLNIILYNII